jgi:CxxC motif-containing protein (DUF1111 family)
MLPSRVVGRVLVPGAAALLACLALPFAARPETPDLDRVAHPVSEHVYARPAPGLDAARRERFEQGRRLFAQHWVVAPSAFGQWGRGPLSNAESCADCHPGNGRGRPPESADEPLRAAIVRLSGGPSLDYGDQLQHQGVLGKVPGEGEAYVEWAERSMAYADGRTVQLRRPRLRFGSLTLGGIDAHNGASLRVPPPLIGLGLLDAVPVAVLEEIARQQRALGVDGRVHRVGGAAGRFGHKATRSSLRHQIAAALHADIGVTSALFPAEGCTARQRECLAFPVGSTPEISDGQLDELDGYLRAAAAPVRRNVDDAGVARGERIFAQIRCAACHVAQLALGVHPYSDLLLHDLGPALADAVGEGEATGGEWRTAPLWGIGLSRIVNGNALLLHDGRARSIEEAILWHGGEGHSAREAFRALPAADRGALIAFVESL